MNSEEEQDELEQLHSPALVFIVFPVIFSILGILVLAQLPRLLTAYNYLRGSPSPIDQIIEIFVGSDMARVLVLLSGIFGMMIGLSLSYVFVVKLGTAKRKGLAGIGKYLYLGSFYWWVVLYIPLPILSLWQGAVFGYPTSHFLSDVVFYLMAGAFLSYSIPVVVGYSILSLYANSIDSEVVLLAHKNGNALKDINYLALKITPFDTEV